MEIMHETLSIRAAKRGLHELTQEVQVALDRTSLRTGTVTVFCCHTSCSLVMMENADISARHDLIDYMDRLVPEDDPHFTHTYEGPDDMPSHIKMALTRTTEVIPFVAGRLCLGTWQGIFLWEHRDIPSQRRVVLMFQGIL
ncbi:MAG: secondary thiamine-phosphate synthase enzyme YjbQ [Opitutales bacterium]